MRVKAGLVYGPYTVLSVDRREKGHVYWKCRCACGNEVVVRGSNLRPSIGTGCGCPARAMRLGVSKTREYRIWRLMLARCGNPSNPNYPRYGGRGITVCERWHHFPAFLEDVGAPPSPGYTLDRFPDNDGNYEPGNVRWATRKEQARNTATNHLITFRGETHCLSAWAEKRGLPVDVLSKRLRSGWDVGRALSAPVMLALSRKGVPHEDPQDSELQTP